MNGHETDLKNFGITITKNIRLFDTLIISVMQ